MIVTIIFLAIMTRPSIATPSPNTYFLNLPGSFLNDNRGREERPRERGAECDDRTQWWWKWIHPWDKTWTWVVRPYLNWSQISATKRTTFFYLNCPIYVGFTILDLSKVLYDFHNNYMVSNYRPQAKLLFTDTDNLCYDVKTDELSHNFTSEDFGWQQTNVWYPTSFGRGRRCYNF